MENKTTIAVKDRNGHEFRVLVDDKPPHFSEFHKMWYVWGKRWIKTKAHWSTNVLLHNFVEWKAE